MTVTLKIFISFQAITFLNLNDVSFYRTGIKVVESEEPSFSEKWCTNIENNHIKIIQTSSSKITFKRLEWAWSLIKRTVTLARTHKRQWWVSILISDAQSKRVNCRIGSWTHGLNRSINTIRCFNFLFCGSKKIKRGNDDLQLVF